MKPWRLAAVAVVTVLSLPGAGPSSAHETPRGVQSVLDKVTPDVEGLRVRVHETFASRMLIDNRSEHVVSVLDEHGVPFLRIGPDGVEANLNAEAWYRSNNPYGSGAAPGRPGDDSDWDLVSSRPVWGFFDHRMHPSQLVVPSDAAHGDEPTVLRRWSIPIRVGDRRGEIRGHVEYVPPLGSYRVELTSGPRPIPGVTASVLQGRVPGVFLENTTGQPVVVLGSQGEPFLRIGPEVVEANLRSPTWVEVAQLGRVEPVPEGTADAEAKPEWKQVAGGSRYAWLELRAHYVNEVPPGDVLASRKITVMREWEIGVTSAGSDAEGRIEGRTLWQPTPRETAEVRPSRSWVVPALIVVALGGLILWRRVVRRPRLRAPAESPDD